MLAEPSSGGGGGTLRLQEPVAMSKLGMDGGVTMEVGISREQVSIKGHSRLRCPFKSTPSGRLVCTEVSRGN